MTYDGPQSIPVLHAAPRPLHTLGALALVLAVLVGVPALQSGAEQTSSPTRTSSVAGR